MDTSTKTKLVAVIKDSLGDAVAAVAAVVPAITALADIETAVAALDASTSTEAQILDAYNALRSIQIGSLTSITSDWNALTAEVNAG